jgi:hypothetical protein
MKVFRQNYGLNASHEFALISLSLGSEDENNQKLQGTGSTGHMYTMRSPQKELNICISFMFKFTAEKYVSFCGEKSIRCYRIEKLVQLLRVNIFWSKWFRIFRPQFFYASKMTHPSGTQK